MTECKICVAPIWEFSGVIENNMVKILREDGTLASISNEPDFDQIQMECFENAAFLKANNKWGFADVLTGNVLVQPAWDFATEYYSGLALVATCSVPASCTEILRCEGPIGGKWGCIDLTGKIIIPAEYESLKIKEFNNKTVILAVKDGLTSMLDRNGNVLLLPKYSDICIVGTDGLICRETDGTYCFWHDEHPVFDGARIIYKPTSSNYYIACKGRKYAVFCTDGRMISDFSLLLREAKKLVQSFCGTTKYEVL